MKPVIRETAQDMTVESPLNQRVLQVLEGEGSLELAALLAGERDKLERTVGIQNVVLGVVTRSHLLALGAASDGVVLFIENGEWFAAEYEAVKPIPNAAGLPLHQVSPASRRPLDAKAAECAAYYTAVSNVLIGAVALYQVTKVHETCIAYSKQRHTFGVPIAKHQMVMDAIVVADSELVGNRLHLLEMAQQLANGTGDLERIRKYTEFLLKQLPEILDAELPVLGAYGLVEEAGVLSFVSSVYHLAIIGGA